MGGSGSRKRTGSGSSKNADTMRARRAGSGRFKGARTVRRRRVDIGSLKRSPHRGQREAKRRSPMSSATARSNGGGGPNRRGARNEERDKRADGLRGQEDPGRAAQVRPGAPEGVIHLIG